MSAMTKKIFKDIVHRKLRTILTILGITVGILSLSAINVASNQFKSSLAYSTNITSAPDMHIYTAPTNPDLADVLQDQPNVKTVQAEGNIVTRWAIGQDHKLLQIVGILDFQHVQINRFRLVEGSLPGPNQIVLETGARSYENVPVGGHISIQVGRAFKEVTVSGFVQTQGLPQAALVGRAYGYMAESSFEQLFNTAGVTDFAIQLVDYAQRYQTLDQLATVLQENHVSLVGSSVGRDDSITVIANGIFGLMDLLSVAAIALSVILLLGTIASLIAEQVEIIGTMKALGGLRGKIVRHYLGLVFCYALSGTLIGVVVGTISGYALANYLASLVSLDIGPLQIVPWQILESLAVGLGTPLLAAFIPVWIGTRITVRQALQGYGLENTASRKGSRKGRSAIGLLPQTIQFGVRNVFRKPTRTFLALLTLAVAGASFLAVQTANYSLNALLNRVYDVYRYNVMISLSTPEPFSRFQQILGPVDGVGSIESFYQDTASTRWGQAALTGVQLDTRMYHRELTAGRWFTASDQNAVIISQDAADISGLKVGDTISFTLGTSTARWHIIGITRDYSDIGAGNLGILLAPIPQIDAMLHIPAGLTQNVMIQASVSAPSQAYLDGLTRRVDAALSNAGFIPQITTPQEQIAQNQSKYEIIYLMLDVVAIIIALVGAISLANSLAMNVLERRREIGILRSMGAISRKVAQVFWAEGTTLGVLAWICAVFLGIPAAYGLNIVQAHLLAPVPFAFDELDLV
ncbi:MAG TPA: FtsX-like permease family protein [Ktedonobacteraceae bacterium]|nr:FtsX-like permease family protein [Ktedonobacteraceae bacterium]